PFFQRATVQNSRANRLFVAWCTLPSRPFQGPIILPFQSAMVQVQSPEANITLYGLLSSLFSIDLKNASDSAWWASRPRVGSGTPGQNTAVSAECRLRKTSQSCAFHASSSVFIRCKLSSPLIFCRLLCVHTARSPGCL